MSDRKHDGEDAPEFEELGDEIIVAQETAAHALAARAKVATDQATVVISDNPGPPDRQAASGGAPRKISTAPPFARDRTEKTVVIRDRKSLDRLRREASRRPRARSRLRARTVYLVGAAVLASLAAGTLLATLVNSAGSRDEPSPAASIDTQEPSVAPRASSHGPEVVDLEDLPVVKKKKKKKPVSE